MSLLGGVDTLLIVTIPAVTLLLAWVPAPVARNGRDARGWRVWRWFDYRPLAICLVLICVAGSIRSSCNQVNSADDAAIAAAKEQDAQGRERVAAEQARELQHLANEAEAKERVAAEAARTFQVRAEQAEEKERQVAATQRRRDFAIAEARKYEVEVDRTYKPLLNVMYARVDALVELNLDAIKTGFDKPADVEEALAGIEDLATALEDAIGKLRASLRALIEELPELPQADLAPSDVDEFEKTINRVRNDIAQAKRDQTIDAETIRAATVDLIILVQVLKTKVLAAADRSVWVRMEAAYETK